MTGYDFQAISRLIGELWQRWASPPKAGGEGNWNSRYQAVIFDSLKNYGLDDAKAAILKNRQADLDAHKPSFNAILSDLRSKRKEVLDPEEMAKVETSKRDTHAMHVWAKRQTPENLDAMTQQALEGRSRLRFAVNFARKAVHPDARIWVCYRWAQGERFEDFADPVREETQEAIPF